MWRDLKSAALEVVGESSSSSSSDPSPELSSEPAPMLPGDGIRS